MWSKDPFKAKWTIIACAYSAIRNSVGKLRAPLDRFLSLVCPEIGIIDTAQYLEKMCWVIERDLDGVISLTQTSVPDIASFEDHIKHTIMTERDVVHFCARKGYITMAVAAALAGPQTTASNANAASQQGLLATAPVIPPALPTATNAFLALTVTNPRAAAQQVLGFDIDELLGPARQSEAANLDPAPPQKPYEWTGCMADLYSPGEGSFNFEKLGDGYSTSLYDVGDISDPQSFERMFGEVTENGYFQPSGKIASPLPSETPPANLRSSGEPPASRSRLWLNGKRILAEDVDTLSISHAFQNQSCNASIDQTVSCTPSSSRPHVAAVLFLS